MDLETYKANLADFWDKCLPGQEIAAFRHFCRTDLYFLLRYALDRKDMERQWLFDRCNEVCASPDGHIDLWAREHYKDVWIDEPVATPTGWKRHGDLKVGDWVYGSKGEPVGVVALSERFTDAQCYRIIFDDESSVVCGSGHLWEVERHTRRRKEGGGRVYREKVVMQTHEMAEHDHRQDNRLSIPVAPALLNIEHILPIEPYLLGQWLGDGTTANGMITSADHEIWDWIREYGYEIGESSKTGCPAQTRTIYGLSTQLREIGVLGNKHIPRDYLWANEKQRRELLQGLMDSDGHCHTSGTATFCNQDERLSNDVFDLCQSLGLKPRIYKYDGEKKPYWQVAFQAYKADAPFRLARKLDRCYDGARKNPRRYIKHIVRHSTVETSCIQVDAPDGIYLVGRNLIPTHNSTVITFGKTIQDILASHGDGAIVDRECTIGIFSHTRPIAKGFLRQIKLELERNERLLEWFPDIIYANPQKESTKWSEDEGITVKRKGNPKECTVEAWGVVDGQPIGKHFTHLVYDDIVTRESTTTPDMITKTTDALALSYNLGTDGGKRRFIGTRYHFNDSYKTIMERGTAKPRIYPATDDGTMTGKPVLISQERLDEKRRDQGAYVYSCQMLQNPIADENQGFKADWIQYHGGITDWGKFNVYILIDPANSKKSGSDYTAGWVIGLGEDQNLYVLDMVRDRLNLTQRAQLVMNWHRKYRPMQVRYEKYGMQADISHIKHIQDQENYRFEITEVAGRAAKPDRIKRLIPLFEKKRVYFPRTWHYTGSDGKTHDLVRDFIEEEYKSFPVAIHDDMMDALARIDEPDIPLVFPQNSIYNSVVIPMPLSTYHRSARGGYNR